MISPKLRRLFLLSIPLFVIHGLEEYLTGYYEVFPLFRTTGSIFATAPQGVFLTFQIMWWMILFISALWALDGRWPLILMSLVGLLFAIELHHLLMPLLTGSYYPGLITALLFPFIAFFFWRELLNHFRLPKP